jgi:nascent polypeptide-associated complex subunit alpha
MNSQAQLSAQQLAASGGGGATSLEESGAGGDDDDDDDIPDLEAPEEDGPLDETGVDPKDIDLVMAQVRLCSYVKFVPILDLFNRSIALGRKL